MQIADNSIARAYDAHARSIDWARASNETQLNVLAVMRQLLIQAPSHTPIIDFGTAAPVCEELSARTAADHIIHVDHRIAHLRRQQLHVVEVAA